MAGKADKPKIEDVVSSVLDGDVLSDALKFIAYLKENRINPQWAAENVWKVSYKSYSVCFIRLYGAAAHHGLKAGSWHIVPLIGDYEDSCLSDNFKEIVWANKTTCAKCGQCALKLDKIFGKEYDYACEKAIVFTNPNAEALECVKKLLEMRRNTIKDGQAKKHIYVPVKDRA